MTHMDRIIRTITSDGSLMAAAIDSTEIVYTAQQLHGLSKTACAALGRLLTAASLMGNMLKKEEAGLTLKINGGGPLGTLVAMETCGGMWTTPGQSCLFAGMARSMWAAAWGTRAVWR